MKQFDNDTIIINSVKKSNLAESIKPLIQNKEALKKVTEEIKVYTEEEHIANASNETGELY